ncbi:MAG: SPOR domain-containing protein [candidate division Zixibacteria bacterium]|nr:SPOR domain-containing protein [candidate division Zixibacteria bacterium]
MRLSLIIILFSAVLCSASEVDSLIENGQLAKAYQYLIDNYKNTPDEPEYLFVKGKTEESGETSAAYFKDFINKSSGNSRLVDWAKLDLGKYYLAQKLYVTANKLFENIDQDSPFWDEASYLAAKCLLMSDEYELAADDFKAITDRYESEESSEVKDKLEQFYNWAKLGLADAYASLKDYNQAESVYTELIEPEREHDISAPALLGLQDIAQQQNKQDNSREYANMYNERYQPDSPVIENSGRDTAESISAKPEKYEPAIKRSSGYFIQVGVFHNRENADRMSTLYKESGYKAYIEVFIEGGEEFHRVMVGGYQSKQQAEFVKKRLERAIGEKYFIIKR